MDAFCHGDHADILGTAHKALTIPNCGAVEVARPVFVVSRRRGRHTMSSGKEQLGFSVIVNNIGLCVKMVNVILTLSLLTSVLCTTRSQSTAGDNSDCVYSFRVHTQFYLKKIFFSSKKGQNSYPCQNAYTRVISK